MAKSGSRVQGAWKKQKSRRSPATSGGSDDGVSVLARKDEGGGGEQSRGVSKVMMWREGDIRCVGRETEEAWNERSAAAASVEDEGGASGHGGCALLCAGSWRLCRRRERGGDERDHHLHESQCVLLLLLLGVEDEVVVLIVAFHAERIRRVCVDWRWQLLCCGCFIQARFFSIVTICRLAAGMPSASS